MSNSLPQHSDPQPPDRDGTSTPAPEPLPDPDGVGRAQRSEPELRDAARHEGHYGRGRGHQQAS